MKKTRLFKILLLLTVCCTFLLAGVGCSNSNNDKIEVGNKPSGGVEETFEIVGAEDLYIGQAITDISVYTSKVKAVSSENSYDVTVDDSAVIYGTKGEYELVYKYEDLQKKVKVKVYEAPTIVVQNDAKTVYSYSEYYKGVIDGISATDCFGNALDVRLFDSKEAENADGSLNVGSYTMKFAAVDLAGQVVYVEKAVVISAESAPNISASYSYDVENDNFEITLDAVDYNGYIAISLDGKVLPSDVVVKDNGKLIIDGNYVFSNFVVDQAVTLRLMTAKGYSDASFTMTDKGVVTYDDSAIKEFVINQYECFVSQEIPQIVLTNDRQNVIPNYEIKKDGQAFSNGLNFMPLKDGAYSLEITLREGQVLSYELNAFYNLGFISGCTFSDSVGISREIDSKYNLIGYTVYNYKGAQILAYTAENDADGALFTAFNNELKALTKKQAYTMKIDATSNEVAVSQKIDFTIIGQNTVEILTDSKDGAEGNLVIGDTSITTLDYLATDVGGRVGAYKWVANTEAGSNKTVLMLNSKFSDNLKAGAFLSFDIYATKAISLTWFSKNNALFFYPYGADNFPANVRLYDANGNEIVKDGSKGFWNGGFKSQWITVEICLDEDYLFNNTWRGLSIWSSGLYGNDVYLANVKVSSESFLNDGVVEPDATPNPDQPTDPDQPVTSATVILADESDLTAGNMYANNSSLTSLAYDANGIGGRTGVFKWSTNSTTALSGSNAMLIFGSKFSGDMVEGAYLSFDIYLTKAATLYWADSKTALLYAAYGDSYPSFVKLYDANGVEIVKDGTKGIWSGQLVGQWITIEICLREDYVGGAWRGLSSYSSTGGFDNTNPIYLDNVKVSSESFLNDGVVEPDATPNPDQPTDPDQPVTSATVILADESDLTAGNMYANKTDLVSLTYVAEEIGGKSGVFKWSTTSATAIGADSAMLIFGSKFKDQMITGAYLSFDIYLTKAATLYWADNDPDLMYKAYGEGFPDNVKLYDANGVEIVKDGTYGFFNGTTKLTGQWITVEICLEEDYNGGAWRGLSSYSSNTGGFDNTNPIYLDNVKVTASK